MPVADVQLLREAVDETASVLPAALSTAEAVGRAEELLALQERVAALALRAVADVDARERSAGSTPTRRPQDAPPAGRPTDRRVGWVGG